MERASEDDQTQIRENVPPVDLVPPTSPSASVHQPAPPLAASHMKRASEDDQTQIRENVPPVDLVPPTSPSASVHQPAPPLAGHEEKKDAVWEQIITPDGMFKRPSSGGIYGSLEVLKQPIIARLEELTSMDPTVEVGMEIADSVYLLNLINSANPEMLRAGLQAARGAMQLQKPADSVIHSQQILRAALPNKDNIVNTSPNPTHDEEKFGDEKRGGEVLWEGIKTSLVKFKRQMQRAGLQAARVAKQLHTDPYSPFNCLKPGCCYKISDYDEPYGEARMSKDSKRPMFSLDFDSEPLVNQGIYSSVKSKLASGSKGTKVQSSSASGQVHLQTEKQNH